MSLLSSATSEVEATGAQSSSEEISMTSSGAAKGGFFVREGAFGLFWILVGLRILGVLSSSSETERAAESRVAR